VAKDASIRTAADLAGKRVAVNTLKNIGDSTIRASVRKAGGDPSSIRFVEPPFPDMPAALQAGRVDAVWVVEPFLSASLAEGGRLVASNYVNTAPDLTVAVYFASEKLIKDDPDLVKRFTEAMTESLAYADAHPDEARQVLTTYTQIDEAVCVCMPSMQTVWMEAGPDPSRRCGGRRRPGACGPPRPGAGRRRRAAPPAGRRCWPRRPGSSAAGRP
jgi:hypothetical protein